MTGDAVIAPGAFQSGSASAGTSERPRMGNWRAFLVPAPLDPALSGAEDRSSDAGDFDVRQ